ncbi:capsular polysaccharide synthesis protein [Neisseria sp.]|uniref:capsular polysaccharide synthesis protein n=1 Tax=Neisseria sp. TaxID=192066 RepID=UPI0026DCEA5B|nr:capsular polysaccharide synthesis protein [Neisseria sp.]MDO4907636.1 capsular polysaccharide synthesis protein [Neisseria sp.]
MRQIFSKVELSQNNIFAFWESPNPIPAYLELCKESWIKNIPNCKIHILNHSNLHQYIGDTYDMAQLKSISFAMQSDIISAAVLEKFGGLFLDLDCIVTDNIFDIFNKISDTKLISFGRPDTKAIHLAALYCAKPGNPILTEWRKIAQERLRNKPDQCPWYYFGNGIVNPLFKKLEYKDSFYIIDRTQSGNILESVAFPNSQDPIMDYKKFYFDENFGFEPNILEKVACGIISLHNSWSPSEYKNLYDKEAFFQKSAPIVELLSYILKHDTTKPYTTLPLLESHITFKLNDHHISYKKKYFKNVLVLDFFVNNVSFAFDIGIEKEKFYADIIFRNASSEVCKNLPGFRGIAFNSNKGRIIANAKEDHVWMEIFKFYNHIKDNTVNNQQSKIKIETDALVDLRTFKISNNLLILEGIGILTGQNAREYRDIDYKLIIKSESEEFVKNLAKAHRPHLTATYSFHPSISYDKCWFATPGYKGVDISDVPPGNYELLLKIKINGFDKTFVLKSQKPVHFEHEIMDCDFSEQGNRLIIKKDLKNANWETIDAFYIPKKFSSEKVSIDGYYRDEYNNIIEAPAGLNNVQVRFFGKNNRVVLHKQSGLKNTLIEFKGDNGIFQIGEKAGIFGTFRIGYDCKIKIGSGTTSTNAVYVTCAEKTSITIGDDCMFATNNQIRTDDSHAIYDLDTGKRINHSKDIFIGNHVWIAYGAIVLGGAHIGNGCVLGMHSLAKKQFPDNCVIAGIPAKVVRENIFWKRPLLLNLPYSENDIAPIPDGFIGT